VQLGNKNIIFVGGSKVTTTCGPSADLGSGFSIKQSFVDAMRMLKVVKHTQIYHTYEGEW